MVQYLTEEQKNWSTTLNYTIKSGIVYPTGTHTTMEKLVMIVLKRFKDSNTADHPSSFFPIGQEYTDDLLQVLTGELELVSLIQSDPVLVGTFHELVQKSFAAKVEDVKFLDILLSFNSWVSKMIFKNRASLLTAITKKRHVGDTRSGIQKKQKADRSAALSTTTSTVSALVAPVKTDEVSSWRVKIQYKEINAREGALVTLLIGK
jgi:hypothetical protein